MNKLERRRRIALWLLTGAALIAMMRDSWVEATVFLGVIIVLQALWFGTIWSRQPRQDSRP